MKVIFWVHLAKKHGGKFMFCDGEGNNYLDNNVNDPNYKKKLESKIITWLFFQNSGIGPMQGQANVFYRYAPKKIPFAIKRYTFFYF